MKLLRLNNGSTLLSQWTNYLNGLKIKKGARIALQNISMEVSNDIVINDENDSFLIQVERNPEADTDAGEFTQALEIGVPHGTYKSINAILEQVQLNLNGNMSFGQPEELALQFKVNLDASNKVAINFAKTGVEALQDTDVKMINMEIALLPNVGPPDGVIGFMKTVGPEDRFCGTMVSDIPFSWSSGGIECYMRNDGLPSHWCYGLTKIIPTIDIDMNPVEFDYCLFSLGDRNVLYKANNIVGIFSVEQNDLQEIKIEVSQSRILFYYGGSTFSVPFVYSTNYHVCFSAMENSTVGIATSDNIFKWTKSAFFEKDSVSGNIKPILDSSTYTNDSVQYYNPNTNEPLTATNGWRYLSFAGSKLGNVLGFNDEFKTVYLQNGKFVGDYPYYTRLFPSQLTVYTPNLKLESYSSTGGTRENILAILPDVDYQATTHSYVHESNNLVFIDIDNNNEQNLDLLMIKIVAGDEKFNQPLELTESGCTISILIDTPN